jgi:hypothetical protein
MKDAADQERIARARRRRNGFIAHLVAYFVLIAAVIPLNRALSASGMSWLLPVALAWGVAVAAHCSFAMGIFDRSRPS